MTAPGGDQRWGDSAATSIRVLHLDDDASVTDLTSAFIEQQYDDFEVVTENSVTAAIDRVRTDDIDCVVSDYEMPEMNGLEFLDAVRESYPDLPFILFTGRGSEEIASEAISRGVTDYLQKEVGTDQYTVLCNRIRNAVSQYRAEREIERRSEWYRRILEHSSDYVMVVDEMGSVAYVSPAIERVMGYSPEEIVGTDSFGFVHPDDLEYAAEALAETISDPSEEVTVEFRAETADGSVRWLEIRGSNFLDDPLINGVMVNVRDITQRKHREQALERQKERLGDLTSFLSHDVQSHLGVVDGRIQLASRECDSEHLAAAADAVDRIDEMIEKVMQLARSDQRVAAVGPVELASVADQCWQNTVDAGADAELAVESDLRFEADRERLSSLVENLLVNAVEHGSTSPRSQAPEDAVEHGSTSPRSQAPEDAVEHGSTTPGDSTERDAPGVRVSVGSLADADGFYVEDDGPGIPPEKRDEVFDADYTTAEQGTGLGLAIVRQIADAHGWEVAIADTGDGSGTRFEITGVEPAEAPSDSDGETAAE